MNNVKKAKRADWAIHGLLGEMMEALEESGGEFTPEVQAIEDRLLANVDELAEQGAALTVHSQAMQEVVKREKARLDKRGTYYKRLEGIAKRWCRVAAHHKGVSKYEAGTFEVRLSKPRLALKGGPKTRSDGWVEMPAEAWDRLKSLHDRGLADIGIRPDRNAILARVKAGDEVLDYAAERPAEKTVVVK